VNFEEAIMRRSFLLTRNAKFAQLVDSRALDPGGLGNFESLLIAPVQRIPRYVLLIEGSLLVTLITWKRLLPSFMRRPSQVHPSQSPRASLLARGAREGEARGQSKQRSDPVAGTAHYAHGSHDANRVGFACGSPCG
jgi:hypothetical protein